MDRATSVDVLSDVSVASICVPSTAPAGTAAAADCVICAAIALGTRTPLRPGR